jgi:hypothetical protein
MRMVLPLVSIAIALALAAPVVAEIESSNPSTSGAPAAVSSVPETGSDPAAPAAAGAGETAHEEAAAVAPAVAPTDRGHVRPRAGQPGDESDGLNYRERSQRQKVERAAKAAADDLAWIREQREALASTASADGKRDPRDVELERTEKVLLARIAALRERFGELTADLEKRFDGELPSAWSPTFDCPTCP